MFLGRKSELGRLRKEIEKSGKSAVLLYGRRRIGKTTLIEEALKGCSAKIIRFSAVPDELSENAKRLSLAVGEALGTPMLPIPDFEAVLKYISGLREPVVFAIDEYQDLRLKRKGDIVDAYFRDFIDHAPDTMKVIISGSAIRVMKSLLDKSNPLYKRFTLELPLGELDYLEASLFYPERPVREKIELYAVFGGIPMILSMIDPSLSVEENIEALLLSRDGFARSYTEDILFTELRGTGGAYAAVSRIGNGRRSYSEIESTLFDKESRNSLDYTLEQLVKADFIEKKQPINIKGTKRKLYYELKSNMLRFHLAYIDKQPTAVSPRAFFEKYVRPSLDTFVSHRFEDIARSYFAVLAGKGIRDDIVTVGVYWYDDPVTKTNGEFDVALETIEGYELYEVKYLSLPMKESLVDKEREKILSSPLRGVVAFGFISSSGFEKYGERRISGDELYSV